MEQRTPEEMEEISQLAQKILDLVREENKKYGNCFTALGLATKRLAADGLNKANPPQTMEEAAPRARERMLAGFDQDVEVPPSKPASGVVGFGFGPVVLVAKT